MKNWWKEGIVYQIYPRSFFDSNADGIGDIQGIIRKLDYIASLGVNILWLNPIFTSPDCDNGYDISDYRDIDARYGSLADWDLLMEEMHKRSLHLVADLVVNHSSDQHYWFQQARSSRDNPYRDYYIWHPGKDGAPPNNWTSFFEGPSWEWDEQTQEYYLHTFAVGQPDLNWENPALRQEVYALMRFWLDRGIDGFRMDVINMISKNLEFPDGSPTAREVPCGTEHYINGPRVHEFLREMHDEVLSHYDIFTVGECPAVTPEIALQYIAPERKELSMLFQFEGLALFTEPGKRWEYRMPPLLEYKEYIERWQHALHGKGWNSIFLSNHDFPRALSKMGNDDSYRVPSAKLLLLHTLTLEGTPYIYQGEEIGMTNVAFPSIDDYRDIWTIQFYHNSKQEGMSETDIMQRIHQLGRDNSRTPMQWNDSPQAGFSTGKAWIKVNPNHKEINVEAAEASPQSILHFTREITALRKQHPALIYGDFKILDREHPEVFSYTRSHEKELFLIVLNCGDTRIPLAELPETAALIGSSEPILTNQLHDAQLLPFDARVYQLAQS